MNAPLFESVTFATVGIPAVLFALWKAWLALLMVRGTRIQTSIGIWLVRLYAVVSGAVFIIGVAYLMTVSDRQGWIDPNFQTTRQIMRLVIGTLFMLGCVASFKLWRNVQDLEDRNLERDAIRDAERDAIRDPERDIERDIVRDDERDVARDIQVDIHNEARNEATE